ncbi:MAG: FAD-dependent oxidoreductase [Pseudomonadota bacterium]
MKSQARVVIIGGGIAGCSTVYHLCEEGWTDVVLLERDELTSGTTWHSAAQVTSFGAIQTMVGLKKHSIKLYKELAADPEYPVGYHHGDGGLRLASADWHVEGYRHFISMARGMGVDFELLDPDECKRRHPLITTDGLLGALWDPEDGDIDPAQLCQALARRARAAGAEVHRKTSVTGLTEVSDGWIVHTEAGDIRCEHVVNAGGYRCNEIAAMMGTELPVASMEHQYFVTEQIPELAALDHRVPLIRCPTDDFYQRQEKNGLLIGFYEQDCKTWGLEGIDPAFTMDLCPNDLDRVADVFENAIGRLPCLAEAGIHTIVNGPITYTPDGLPLVGRVPGRRNAWCITGLRAGLGEGGGHGWLLAQEMVQGEACYDKWCLDPRRFSTSYATEQFTALKAIEDYQNEFRFHLPHEHRPAGRPARVTPLTSELAGNGAEFAVVSGWERVSYFKPSADFVEEHGFGFTNVHDAVSSEVKTVHESAGLAEVNGFNRIEISGAGTLEWLDRLLCGRVPKRIGKVGLGYTLTEKGNVLSEATIAVLGEDHVWWGSAAAAEHHDLDWLSAQMPPNGVCLTKLTDAYTMLVIAGPKARDILAAAAPLTDWSKDAFPWLSVQTVTIGHVRAVAMSVSFSGELAWELHIPMTQATAAYHILLEAGQPFGLGQFGLYAIESMRLEKGYRHWKADLITEFNPFEAGLDRFVDLEKDFVGKGSLVEAVSDGARRHFVTLIVEDSEVPAHPGQSVLRNGEVVGTVTSAGWGFRTKSNIAMAYVQPELAVKGERLQIQRHDGVFPAEIVEPVLFDPDGARMRG